MRMALILALTILTAPLTAQVRWIGGGTVQAWAFTHDDIEREAEFVNAGTQEKITLTVAESNTEYRMANLVIVPDDPATVADEGVIALDLRGLVGENISCRYSASTNPTGTFLITALNKANLSTAYAANATTGSLKQRIFHRLVVMAESTVICGKTITGTLAGAVP